MDIKRILRELRYERGRVEEAILSIEKFGYSEQIDLLLTDIEMLGLKQITAERSGIDELLNSANPSHEAENRLPFFTNPSTRAKLKIAVPLTLESQPQAMVHGELEAFPSLVMEGSCPIPEISTPEVQSGEAGATLLRDQPALTRAEDQASRHSRTVLPGFRRRLPEAVVMIREDRRNSPEVDTSTMRTASRNRATGFRERISQWRLPHAVPVWIPVAAALALAIILPVSLHQITEGRPYTVSLQGVRGLADTEAPAGKPLLLNLDVTTLPRSDSYEIQIVDGEGRSLWQRLVPAQGSEVRIKAAPFQAGTYFLRVYRPAGELLKEYMLRTTETTH